MRLFGKKSKTFVLGIDGVPYSFLMNKFGEGKLPHLSKLVKDHGAKRMNSVYPTVSSVAWTSYMTGENPAEHNIFGFVDRIPHPFSITIPTARDRKGISLWKHLSDQGRRVIVINVPLTYPPEEVNGILVGCFLCTDIDKSSYPPDFSNYLKSRDYIIDVDAWLARQSPRKFMDELHGAMEKRFEIAFELMEAEKWDFFQLHIMETDRLFHFFFRDVENEGSFSPDIQTFFSRLDDHIGQLSDRLTKHDRLLILSDHGFCGIKAEVQLNKWLEEQGLLSIEPGMEKDLVNYDKSSTCYSLLPGRIYINLEGREEKGSVAKEDYQKTCQDIRERLLNFIHPASGKKIIDRVFFREEIYQGPYIESSADLIVHPKDGYDLKGRLEAREIFDHSALNGMHTYHDAFICGKNIDISPVENIQDVYSVVMRAVK